MNLLYHNYKRVRFVCMIYIAVLLFAFYPGFVSAQADWFQKSKDLLGDFGKSGGAQSSLSVAEIAAGLKDALQVSTTTVVSRLGKPDGFNADPAIHIPLPENFSTIQTALNKIGMSALLDDLELRLNRAAETATPKAKEIFFQSIKEMTLDDVMDIYKGPDDAATKYFQRKMSQPLAQAMDPIVADSLSEVGAIQSYDKVMKSYRSLPFVPDVKANLTNYVVEQGMNGIFHYMAIEEAAIRKNPTKRTTDLLKRVFGATSQ